MSQLEYSSHLTPASGTLAELGQRVLREAGRRANLAGLRALASEGLAAECVAANTDDANSIRQAANGSVANSAAAIPSQGGAA